MVTRPKLTQAIRLALLSSAAAAAALQAPIAVSQEATLNEIVVTGSRIRRVEAETASPIFMVNREAIEASGVTTMGQLVQQVPAVSGAATNTAVNNGGGDGASTIELRGLERRAHAGTVERPPRGRHCGQQRSDGRRGGHQLVPVNLIERVEVLKEGAGAIYGSDAIGGVVNFITRKDFDGVELSTMNTGSQAKATVSASNVSLAWGTDSDRGSVVLGANYNNQDDISAGDQGDSPATHSISTAAPCTGRLEPHPTGRIRFGGATPGGAALTRIRRLRLGHQDRRCGRRLAR